MSEVGISRWGTSSSRKVVAITGISRNINSYYIAITAIAWSEVINGEVTTCEAEGNSGVQCKGLVDRILVGDSGGRVG